MLLCPQMVGDTTQVEDRAGLGHARLLSLPWGSQAPQVPGSPWQSRSPALVGLPPWYLREPGPFPPWPREGCPWGPWQAGWRVSLPWLGQQGPAHLPTGIQSSPRETWGTGVPIGVLVGSWCWLWTADPKGGGSSTAPWRPHTGMGPWCPPSPKEGLPLGAGVSIPQTQPLELAMLSLLRGGYLLPVRPQALVWG